ncbi:MULTISPECIES: hypothetical protein [Pseudomonas]|jgi:hypothetical protein|uniref:Uncharacterized protein n=1 Tax=Pseudomonas sp. Hg7Tf TaxID=3236988 RepID=A0AB39I572_9PSED|nr:MULTISPECIES: hypothetical protein [Pseudomonas]KJJ99593.1 hypothetical protein UB47_24800 [Pseudomonas sp. 5]MDD1978526.1 hypothetical protein [Pseudomonas putida]MDH2561297.1 hypothetical protein [Pseudomonas sp. Hg5Tf]QYX47146.1 hypothetical protein K3F43_21080 [Pseudomonas sp. S11A 273]
MVETREIEKLRQLGLTEQTSAGVEAVRVTAQCRLSAAGYTRDKWRSALLDWECGIEQQLASHGAELVPGSLSVSGQTVEVVVPIDQLSSVVAEMADADVRIDIVTPHQVVER